MLIENSNVYRILESNICTKDNLLIFTNKFKLSYPEFRNKTKLIYIKFKLFLQFWKNKAVILEKVPTLIICLISQRHILVFGDLNYLKIIK